MNSLQFFGSLRPTSNSVIKRYTFSKADLVKLWNYTNKALYGPLKKSKPSNDDGKVLKADETSTGVHTLKKPETSYESERYWLTGNRLNETVDQRGPKTISNLKKKSKKQSKNVNRIDKENTLRYKSEKLPEEVAIQANVNTYTVPQNPTNSVKLERLLESKIIKPNEIHSTVAKKPILLTNEEITNILNHPLQAEVVTTSQTDLISANDLRTPQLRNIPSVGKILQYTMSDTARTALLNWKLSKIRELGEQGFADLQQSNLNSGFTFHWSLQNYFATNEIPIASSPVYKLWESVRGVLDTFSAMPEIVEKPLFHSTLKYKGICDCVSEVENQLTIIEWKKSCRSKGSIEATYDAPLQLCAYLGALNSMSEYQGRIRQGMIVVAYENGKQADVYKLNEIMLRKYWRVWLGRVQEFWIRSRDNTLLEPI